MFSLTKRLISIQFSVPKSRICYEQSGLILVDFTLYQSKKKKKKLFRRSGRANWVAGVSTDMFNLSLSQPAVPTCFNMFTIVPAPKKAKVTELNYYRPVALTSVIMKCFEKLFKDHITSTLPDTLDPLQLKYHPNSSTDDVIAIALHTALSHLDKRNTYSM